MTYGITVGIQIIAIVITFLSLFHTTKQKASFEQNVLVIILCTLLLYNLSSLFLMTSTTRISGLAYFRMQYIGIAFVGFLYMLFVARFLHHRINPLVYALVLLDSVIVLAFSMIFETGWHGAPKLFFTDFALEYRGGVAYAVVGKGILYYVDAVISFVAVVYMIAIAIRELGKARDMEERKRIHSLMVLVGVSTLGFFVNELFLPPHVNIFPLIVTGAMIYLFIMIERFGLIDVVATARERVFETMPDAVLVVDERHVLRDINKAGETMFPELSAMLGRELPDKLSFLLRDPEDELGFEHNGVHFDRQMSPVFYRGKLTGYCIVLCNVTHLHSMLKQMKQLKKDAEAASDSKTVFLTGMSHEIRTPMNAIVGYSDLLVSEVTTEAGVKYAKAIKSSTNSLLHIVNDILDFSKIQQGRLEIVEEEYISEQLFREVRDIMEVGAERKNIKLLFSISPDMPAVLYGDRMRIRQILVNIIGNAVKFTNEGSVRVVAEWDKFDDDRADITIIISDTGTGMTEDEMNRVFREFERSSIKRDYGVGGAGLGLCISKSLLEMMGGTIDIESEFGVGTSVVINIKQRIIDAAPMASLPDIDDDSIQSVDKVFAAPDAKVLVVDDNAVNLELMISLLKPYRIIPDTASGGEISVSMCNDQQYDLIFMDQMMPGMDGVEAMKLIRESGKQRKDVPIVALTANAIVGTKQKLIAEGFTDYVSKPLPVKTLEEVLKKYLPGGSYTIEASPQTVAPTMEAVDGLDNVADGKRNRALPAYIDKSAGMENCGGTEDDYRGVVEIVYKYAGEKLAHLEELFKAKDYTNYTIEVHALKSNAATIGALELSERAKALEMAGKENRFDEIERDHAAFAESYGAFAHDIAIWLGVEEETEKDDTEHLSGDADSGAESSNEYLDTLKEVMFCISEQRFDDASDLLGVFDLCTPPPVLLHVVNEMRSKAQAGDWTGVSSTLANVFAQ